MPVGGGGLQLPDFPWDSLTAYAATAQAHPDGIVDLSVGTPVDSTPSLIQAALADAADSAGYPQTAGTPELRSAICAWLQRRFGAVVDPSAVLPVIGTKELVAWLPTLLGARRVAIPALAYPTYDVGARLAGAQTSLVDEPGAPDLVWLNSPSNPTGEVLPPAELSRTIRRARRSGAVVASDECYADLYYGDDRPASVLSPDVCDGDHTGLLAVHSLSKRSNLAGYRAGFVAGDPAIISRLLELRRHAGMIVPGPVQAAMVASLGDDEHVAAQRATYSWRRDQLAAALRSSKFKVQGDAGLYLWVTAGDDCWTTVALLAQQGILVAPGSFYGPTGQFHVRVALTATDERIEAACARLA